MTNLKTTLLALFCIFFADNLFSQINTTENFQNFSTADGLVSDDITDVYIQDNSNIWIATSAGLSHFDGTTFTNYTTANSNLINDDLTELEYSQNKIWMISTAGLSSFDGSTFTNYTTANGLLSNTIEGITTTSNDTLWITTLNGTSKFDGTSFTHYTSQRGRDIETDSLDRVYVIRTTFTGNFPFMYLYETGAWTTPTPNINFTVNGSKLTKTASNSLYITGYFGDPSVFGKINYPLNLKTQNIYHQGFPVGNNLYISINPQQFEEYNGLRWMGGVRDETEFYYVSSDSNYIGQYIKKPNVISSCIKAKGNILAIGSDQGLYLTKPTKKRNKNGVEFAINSIKTSVNQTGPLFRDAVRSWSDFEFPKDSNSYGIFSAHFIVAAKELAQNNFTVSSDYKFIPGPRSTSAGTANNYMVSILKQDIINHIANYNQAGYVMPESIRDWPTSGDSTLGIAADLAPFFDANNNGCYDPQNGDYPIIKGDQAIYWINYPIDQNLELEYHWMMYGFDEPANKSLHQSIFIQYTIINRSIISYDSVKVGFLVNGGVGVADDYAGTDSLNNLIYFYNGDAYDGLRHINGYTEFGNTTPALGVKFLSDSLTSSLIYNIGNTGNTSYPQTEQDWINSLNARWKNGQLVTFGGDGYQNGTTTIPTSHMYTGNPSNQTGWSELSPGSGLSPNYPYNRTILGSMPYFSLSPQGRKTIEVAIGYGRTSDTSAVIGKNIAEMTRILNQVKNFWDTLSTPPASLATNDTCKSITSIREISELRQKLELFPNPTKNNLQLNAQIPLVEVQIFDMKGALVKAIQPTSNTITINVSNLKEGIHFLKALTKEGMESKKFMVVH